MAQNRSSLSLTRPFLAFGKVIFNEQVNVWERYCKADSIHIFKTLIALFTKLKVLKGLISHSASKY